MQGFHPAVSAWLTATFAAPTEPQRRAWPAIRAGRHTLIAAPTGSGKTLAAFLAAIDSLVRQGQHAPLPDRTQVLYVSPLKALSNDIHRNLQEPLEGIRERLRERGDRDVPIRALVRTGDTPTAERTAMTRRPPHLLVTTPESLYLLLTSEGGRKVLQGVHTVIVDEIHALAGNKRGAHLSLSLERLQALVQQRPEGDAGRQAELGLFNTHNAPLPARRLVRIGLSATQRPIDEVARFLVGSAQLRSDGSADCEIIDAGHSRRRDLAIELPRAPLEAVMANEVWAEVYDRLAELVQAHRTTLVFVNTRRSAERVTRHLSERLGEEAVTSHHGSLAREQRLAAEQRLKAGDLSALVATASLELGIDIGDVDLVCQLGSPGAVATLLQRVGRSGHGVNGLPKGRLFPLSRDDLVECAALLDAVRRDELEHLSIPHRPLDVLAQQIVAAVAAEPWSEPALYELVRRAWPYRGLSEADFDALLEMLAEGFASRRGRRAAHLHRDAVNHRLRPRRGARLTALTNGGAIPDVADYRVVLEPGGAFVGTLDEDFAIESVAGDIFQLGNHSYRILRIESGRVRVEDAHGLPPSIPFWFGEAPARSDEASLAVSRLRTEVGERARESLAAARDWLTVEVGLSLPAARQLVDYLAAARAFLGVMPSQRDIVLERFFDESGGMQLVVHSPFGARINRAWGLALRKRFCRSFNFELQAAATEDAIVLSLGETHSFVLEDVARYLNPATVREILVQALLDAPMFTVRWRWSCNIALAVARFAGGRKVPAQIQRMQAEDLVAVAFPDQLACFENLTGDRRIPDHPLVQQAIHDCLHEAMDIDGLERLTAELVSGERRVHGRDVPEPSPLALEILGARPYAFLDDAPLEERRTRAVLARRWLSPETAADLGALDPDAVARVRDEAWPEARDPDELHDALVVLGFLTAGEGRAGGHWPTLLALLQEQGRAAVLSSGSLTLWVAAERLPQLQALFPQARLAPQIQAPARCREQAWTPETALPELLRGRLQGLGPVTLAALAAALAGAPTGLPGETEIQAALLALEAEGFVLRGRFSPSTAASETGAAATEWCERRLLARIHRYTIKRLRAEIEPVSSADLMAFLFRWQGVANRAEAPGPASTGLGPQALKQRLEQLEGIELPAAAWEEEVLPARIPDYQPAWLDNLCLSGRIAWLRLSVPKAPQLGGPVRATPIALVARRNLRLWKRFAPPPPTLDRLSSTARRIAAFLAEHGACFFDDLLDSGGLLRTQVEQALAELVAAGRLGADSYAGLRALLTPAARRGARQGVGQYRFGRQRRARFQPRPRPAEIEDGGRWALLDREPGSPEPGPRGEDPDLEPIARILLQRCGIVFRRLLERETALPPWRDLVWVYRRLEARGELRGGRFVAGHSGEQYALPEAVAGLREARRRAGRGEIVTLSAADPLNLTGIVTPGERIPALTGNRVVYRDGAPVAARVAGEVRVLAPEPKAPWLGQVRRGLSSTGSVVGAGYPSKTI